MLSTKTQLSLYVLLVCVLFLGLLTLQDRPTQQYPHISSTNTDRVQIDFLWQAEISAKACKDKLTLLDEVVMADCPDCQINTQVCLAELNPIQKSWLGNDLVDLPTVRLSNGVIAFQALDLEQASKACKNIQSLQVAYNQQLTCTPSHARRALNSSNDHGYWVNLIEIIMLIITTGFASWFICYLILRYENMHAHFSHDHINAGIQKFHAQPTPRIAGIALLASLLVTLVIEWILHNANTSSSLAMTYFVLACLPVFFGGFIEDITKNVGVAQRLLFSMLTALMAIWLMGALINRTDIMALDSLLTLTPVAVAITVLGIAGVCNAMNIIDGYNGLSAGYAAIALSAISCIAFQVNDHLVLSLSLGLMGGLLGFLCWNWPHGKIFMGDGGAYLVGFSLAELAILLVYRNPSVSPWFTSIILGYPIFETIFSMFRRKVIAKTRTGQPDAGHFHQLIFFKILHGQKYTDVKKLTWANSRVALFIWIPAALVSIVATLFWQSTAVLMPLTLGGCVVYVLLYYSLARRPD
jgi:UDP-N-acetylmuramyl pentapeptide phosphotransferase/UDP-N-acetylglucosamine-1-phosphate transferase